MKSNIKEEIKKYNFDYVIVDAMNIVHKYFWTMRNLTDKNGNKTGIYYGILNFVYNIRKKYNNPKIAFVWDTKANKKKSINKSYKANRTSEKPCGFWEQVRELKILLSLYNVYQFYAEGYEADDVAGKIVKDKLGNKILLVSSDNDWFELLKYNDVKILKDNFVWNRKQIEEKYNVNVSKQTLFKAIVGEKKENVEGIKRIPKDFVRDIIDNENNIESVFLVCDRLSLKSKWYKWSMEILKNKKMIKENYELKKMITTGYELSQIKRNLDKKRLLAKIKEYDMNKLYERISNE